MPASGESDEGVRTGRYPSEERRMGDLHPKDPRYGEGGSSSRRFVKQRQRERRRREGKDERRANQGETGWTSSEKLRKEMKQMRDGWTT